VTIAAITLSIIGPTPFYELLPVRVVLEDRLGPVASIQQVIDRAGVFHSQFTRRDRKRSKPARN